MNLQVNAHAVGLLFYLLDKMYSRTLSHELHFAPIDRYFHILWLVRQHQNQISQQQLTDLLKCDKAVVTRMLRYLEKKGVIQRVANPNDQRSKWLRLTPKGERTLHDIIEAIDNLHTEMFMGFSQKEIADFFRMLIKVYQNLSLQPHSDALLQLLNHAEPKHDSLQ